MVHLYDKLMIEVAQFEHVRAGLTPGTAQEQLRDAKLIVHYDAVDVILENAKGDKRPHEYTDKLYPLFANCFVETQFQLDQSRPHPAGALLAAHAFDKDDDNWKDHQTHTWLEQVAVDPDNVKWVYNIESFCEVLEQPVYLATAIVFVDNQGAIMPLIHPGHGIAVSYALIPYEISFKALRQIGADIDKRTFTVLCEAITDAALYTVDFIHRHKNIELECVTPIEKNTARRARERKGLPPLKPYHVIKIKSGRGAGEFIGRRGGRRSKSRFHAVRGHTREYPDGLFGNPALAGEYYIPPFVRGNKEKGQVKKHYQVGDGEYGDKVQS